MPDREPSLLREPSDAAEQPDRDVRSEETSQPANHDEGSPPRRSVRATSAAAPIYRVSGFWRRLAGALIDGAIVLPVSLVLGWLAGAVSGIHLPVTRHRGLDFWLDLLLANDPAFIGWLVLTGIVAAVYLLVFQTVLGRTLGMKATKTRIIDVYGDPPNAVRAGLRTGGYLIGFLTLGLGFVWAAFDAEKRGVHDWLSGTYVVRD